MLAEKLTGHLPQEIVVRGSRGGPLFSLATQLNDDTPTCSASRSAALCRQLRTEIVEALDRRDAARLSNLAH